MISKILKVALFSTVLAASSAANAGLIGVWNGSGFSDDIANAGHTFVSVNASSTLADLSLLDQVWLIRSNGDADLNNYVLNGGTLVTEWSASAWALNTMSMLNATDNSIGFVGTNTNITFTQSGIDIGLGDETGNPYANSGATQYFRSFTNIGSGVDIIAQTTNYNVGIAGSYGLGNVVALGWDWQDSANSVITQQLVNDITSISFNSVEVPEPSTLAIFALGMIGLASRRFQKQS